MADKQKPQGKSEPTKGVDDGIGIRLKAAREAKGMSQSDLHTKTGLSRTVLINYEAGRHKPGTRELRLLCDALEVTPNHLIYGSEEPHSRTDGLADIILSMGKAAILPAGFIVPMAGAMLGKDDTRTILTLVESLLKAKDPVGYSSIMELLEVFREQSKMAPDEKAKSTLDIMQNPAAAEEVLKKRLMEKVKQRVEKLGEK